MVHCSWSINKSIHTRLFIFLSAPLSLSTSDTPALLQLVQTQGLKSAHYPYSGAQKHNYGVVDVPEGCSLVAHIPGDEEAFAVLYTCVGMHEWGCGDRGWV